MKYSLLIGFVLLAAGMHAEERIHRIYSPGRALNGDERQALERNGLRILEYLGDGRYSVSLPAEDAIGTIAARYRPLQLQIKGQKLGLRVEKGAFPGWSQTQFGVMVDVRYWADVTMEKAREKLSGTGLRVIEEQPFFRYIRVAGDERDVRALGREDWVERVEVIPPPVKEDSNAVSGQLIGADVAQGGTYNAQGQGVKVGIIDGGAVFAHREFDSRLSVVEAPTVSSHATHVAGTVASAGRLMLV